MRPSDGRVQGTTDGEEGGVDDGHFVSGGWILWVWNGGEVGMM